MSGSVAGEARPLLVVLSHLRWDFVFQRPQQLLSRAANDYRVVYIEEPVREQCAEPRIVSRMRGGVEVVQPHVPEELDDPQTLAFQKRVVDRYTADNQRMILWFYTPMALPFARHVAADAIVFDKMDELAAFKNAPPVLLALEQELLDLADIVFTGGASMHAAAAHRHENIHCFPSSVDTAHFGKARAGAFVDPEDQQALARPRIGFFGVIDERFDVPLLAAVAARRPDWNFVMLGPVVKIDSATLPRAANIHWLGGKDYQQLPSYLAHWDVGWMPFAINEATRFISPTKTPEFLAAGLPVVSTAIRDVVQPYGDAGLVTIAADPCATEAAIDALLGPFANDRLDCVDAHLSRSSWDSTWRAMHSLVAAVGAVPADKAPAHARNIPTMEFDYV